MKTWLASLFVLIVVCGEAKTIIVTTTNNLTAGPTETNLVRAIQLLADGDTIQFDLPGSGPHYLITPPLVPNNGYPAITNHNVTIDGYSQPGAAPNTNSILAANTAQIKIVLDSRLGGRRVEDIPGYGTGESSVLLVKGATNVTIRGLIFLGPGKGAGDDGDPAAYAISLAGAATGAHINGCWFGVAPDRTNLFRFQNAITGFQGAGEIFPHGTIVGVAKTAGSTAEARSQFNVILGEYIPILLEGHSQRIAGNFFNVFPDGGTDYNVNGFEPYDLEAFIEIGRSGNGLVIGTDGDGRNDADERNVFGGVTHAAGQKLLQWYGAAGHDMVIAGNYIGVAVDGVTRFTNSCRVFDKFNSSANVRIGTDGDGVSDEIEGNVIAMNHPFAALFPTPELNAPEEFARHEAGAKVSLRGNRLIGNNLAPFSYANGYGNWLAAFTNYCAPYFNPAPLIPVLATNSSQTRLRGSCAPGLAPFTNIVIDLYLADPEGWTNGQKFELAELAYTDPLTSQTKFYGFAQGATWLGALVDNGPLDANPAVGEFEFDLTALNLDADQLVTLTATYSSAAPGTHNAMAHTSAFAHAIRLQPTPRLTIAKVDGELVVRWPTNAGIFTIQSTATLTAPAWTNLNPGPLILINGTNFQTTVPTPSAARFFRLAR